MERATAEKPSAIATAAANRLERDEADTVCQRNDQSHTGYSIVTGLTPTSTCKSTLKTFSFPVLRVSALTRSPYEEVEVNRVAHKATRRRLTATIAGVGALALVLSACGGSSTSSSTTSAAATSAAATSGGGGGASAGADSGPVSADSGWCDTVKEKYGDLTGKTVGVYTVITGTEADAYRKSYELFNQCTGATATFEDSKDFEAQINVRIDSGNPPDVAIFPQPGLLSQLVNDKGAVKPLPEDIEAFAKTYFPDDWMNYGVVNDIPFGIPNNADFKSLVWYNPSLWKEKGWTVPTTWDELQATQKQITDSGVKPWCMGIGSGAATGWYLTDWLEEYVLRMSGPDVYDQWVTNDVKFTDPAIADALAGVGEIAKNPAAVNAGFGDVATVASAQFSDPAAKVLSKECPMWRFAANGDAFFPAGTKFGPDGDVDAFYFPPMNDKFGQTVLGGGTFYAAFQDRPEVQAFLTFISSPEYANERAKAGSYISANRALDGTNASTPILQTALKKLQDPDTTFRFDASDLMPAPVGSAAEWKQFTAWITGQDDATTLANIQAAWPAS